MTISAISNVAQLFQRVSEAKTEEVKENKEIKDEKKVEGGAFDEFLRGIMGTDPAKETNEEELFAALIQERLATHVDEEAAEAFAAKLAETKAKHTRGDGHVFIEDAAKEALAALVTDKTIDQETADKVGAEAFAAAQLDDNKNELWDSRGSENDPTKAVAAMEAALISAREIISKIESGEMTAEAPAAETTTGGAVDTSSVTPTGNAIDGDKSGFLFKPVSESNGNLVILLPAQMAKMVEGVVLKDKDGNEIEKGVSHGFKNPDQFGDREHFRFTKPGASYPGELTVEVMLNDGTTKQYKIPDPSQRYD